MRAKHYAAAFFAAAALMLSACAENETKAPAEAVENAEETTVLQQETAEESAEDAKAEKDTEPEKDTDEKNSDEKNAASDNKNKETPEVKGSFFTEDGTTCWYNADGEETLTVQGDTTQIIKVEATGGSDAIVTMYEQLDDGTWDIILDTKGYVGADGIGKLTEYNSCTPEGEWGFVCAFGNAEDPGCEGFDYIQVDETMYWIATWEYGAGDYYNTLISTNDVTLDERALAASEQLSAYPAAYKYALALDYNESGTPESGSCIFLHCTYSGCSSTGGCIAIPEEDMASILKNVTDDCRIIIKESEWF